MTLQEPSDQRRMYGDLAWTWPIVSPLDQYAQEAEDFRRAILQHAREDPVTLLDLGCGGGHNDHHLTRYFQVTGIDLSDAMLSLARRLNPDVTYVHGDMRSSRLGITYDAVIIADSITYMLTEDDLRSAFTTAFEHLRRGGVFCTYADDTRETFKQHRTNASVHTEEDVEITLFEHAYDPDPFDTTYEMTFVYLIRRAGDLEIQTDRHLAGLFPRDTWLRLLAEVGFSVRPVHLPGCEAPMFVAIKPS